MLQRSPIARCLWLLAIALLLVRVGDAHLHLCLDGQASTAAMHVGDAPTHDGSDVSIDGHHDVDVDLSVLPWIRAVAADETPHAAPALIALEPLVLALLVPALESIAPPARYFLPALVPVRGLRPPLRGPPR